MVTTVHTLECELAHHREALARIAYGRTDCGRPFAAELSRQLARDVLTVNGSTWHHVGERAKAPA